MPPEIPLAPQEGQEGDSMPEATPQFASLHDQNMAAMGQAIARFQNDATTVSKAADYSYLQDKDLVSLAEAVGAREVSSRVNPAGPVPSTDVSPSPSA